MSLSSLFKSVSEFLNKLQELKNLNRNSKDRNLPENSEMTTSDNHIEKSQSLTPQREHNDVEHNFDIDDSRKAEDTVNHIDENNGPSVIKKKSAISEIKENAQDVPPNSAIDVNNEALIEKPVETTPDVYLDVPSLKVQELKLDVEDLNAKVALNAELAGLIKINVGVTAGIKKLDLDLKGVDLKAVLKVRLKQVYAIFDRALTTIDSKPDILKNQQLPQSDKVQQLQNETFNDINKKMKNGDSPIETNHSLTKDEQRYRFREDAD